MDQTNSITNQEKRKRGKHLTLDERGMIQALYRNGYTLRAIADCVGCAHTTVFYELRRGTPIKKGTRGRKPLYTAKRGQVAYEAHRRNCRKPLKLYRADCEPFIQELTVAVKERRMSIDEFIGSVKRQMRFAPLQMLCTKTVYNMLNQGRLPFTVFDVPQLLRRGKHHRWIRKHKRLRGTSIDARPKAIAQRLEIGHWEGDTVIGHRNGKESCIFTLVEMVTHKYITIKISGRTTKGVQEAMLLLRRLYGRKHFSDVFKSITVDNGAEFQDFAKYEKRYGTKVYFAHPYSAWERPQNERHNRMLREYLPKGESVDHFSADEIMLMADKINTRPRRSLQYHTAEEMFTAFIDKVYAIENIA